MSRTTRSGARVPPPAKQISGSQAVQCEKPKPLPLPLRKGQNTKPTRKSNQSTSNSSQKNTATGHVEKHMPELDSDDEDELPDEEDIYRALESDSDESDAGAGKLDSDDEVLEGLARS